MLRSQRMTRSLLVFAAIFATQCAQGDGKLRAKPGAELGNTQCENDAGVCPSGQMCAIIDLADGPKGPICVAPNVCDLLTCGGSPYYCVFLGGNRTVACIIPQ